MISPSAGPEVLRRFIIVLEIATPTRDLQKLTCELKSLGNWWHCLGQVWIVQTTTPARAVRDLLRRRLEADDKLLLLEIDGEAAWAGFDGEPAAWLKDNLLPRGASTRARMPSSEVACP